MKVGDLVICKRAYNKKGIIVNIRERMYYSQPVCDVWVYELDDDKEEVVGTRGGKEDEELRQGDRCGGDGEGLEQIQSENEG